MDVVESVDGSADTSHLAPALRMGLLRAGTVDRAGRGRGWCGGGAVDRQLATSLGRGTCRTGAGVEDDQTSASLELGQ